MKILFVEDDEAIALGLVYTLQQEGYNVIHVTTKKQALQKIEQEQFQFALLDVSLPDGSGYEICRKIKSSFDIPVIFLTAMDDEGNIVMGLDIGGDDYICKPFRIRELLSRMKSVLRRYDKTMEEECIHLKDIDVYPKQGKVYKNKKEVLLTAMEYRLLFVFINHQGQVLSRNQLLEGIWDVAGDFVNDNTLTVYIKRLREKLEKNPQEPEIITTVRGLGYRLEKYI